MHPADQADIRFPRSWEYKLIGRDADAMRAAAAACLAAAAGDGPAREHRLEDSRRSRAGKFVSLKLQVIVADRNDRDEIYRHLVARPEILMVI